MSAEKIQVIAEQLGALPDPESRVLSMMIAMLVKLEAISEELSAIRLATEQANEPGPDDEPSPFQSLNG